MNFQKKIYTTLQYNLLTTQTSNGSQCLSGDSFRVYPSSNTRDATLILLKREKNELAEELFLSFLGMNRGNSRMDSDPD